MNIKKYGSDIHIKLDKKFHNKTILDFLKTYHQSKKHIHTLRMSQKVKVNDVEIKQNFQHMLTNGDVLSFPFFIDEEPDFIPQSIQLDIAYEDDYFLIINKQPNILVHPSEKDGLGTLANGVSYYYQNTHQKHRVRYLHRLDKDTTGLIIFVKNAFLHAYYDILLQKKQIKRHYYAIVEGVPNEKHGIITKNIGRDRHHSSKRIITRNGDFARTHYQIISSTNHRSLLACQLDTGRTHQIRVHLSSIGHPIIGDPLYQQQRSRLINRQALHAYKLILQKPFSDEVFDILTELPEDMKDLLK